MLNLLIPLPGREGEVEGVLRHNSQCRRGAGHRAVGEEAVSQQPRLPHLRSAGKQTWLESGARPAAWPPPGPSPRQQRFFFKSNVAWKSLLLQLPLKPIVSSAPLTCQILAAADGANTPPRAAIQFKIASPAQTASEPAHLQISPNRGEGLRAQFDHAAS